MGLPGCNVRIETQKMLRGGGKAIWAMGEELRKTSKRLQGSNLIRELADEGCIHWGLQIQLALSQHRPGIRWQSSHAKAAASHADCGSCSSISEIFSGQIIREAETRSARQAGRELPIRTPLPFAGPLELYGTSWQNSHSDPQTVRAVLGITPDPGSELGLNVQDWDGQ